MQLAKASDIIARVPLGGVAGSYGQNMILQA